MTNIKEIYEKFRNGDPLSDNEVAVGFEHFKKAAEMVSVLGPRFDLAANELRHVARVFEDYINARKRK